MEKKLNHDFCEKFRNEIKAHGLVYIIVEILTSSSDKVPLKKQYLARECKKTAAFKTRFQAACVDAGIHNRKLRPALNLLKAEICA